MQICVKGKKVKTYSLQVREFQIIFLRCMVQLAYTKLFWYKGIWNI